MKPLKNLIYLLIVFILISSCSSDDEPLPAPLGDYENGILITILEGSLIGNKDSVFLIS